MPEENQSDTPKIVNYGGNSSASKKDELAPRPEVKQITTGAVVERKKTVGRKFREQFAGDDIRTVGQSILFDVIVPATKNLLFDMITEGGRRLLFGGSRTGGVVASSLLAGGRTSYNRMFQGGPIAQATAGTPASREMTPQARAMHDFSGVILESRAEGEMIIDALTELIDAYGVATVNDFYACIGQSSEFTSVKYGWKSLAQASVKHIREGYLLDMPRPIVLE